MTNQEIFDKVATHLLTQRRKASDNNKCLYRYTPPGEDVCLKCAAGILIPDDKYNPDMEGKMITLVVDSFGLSDVEPFNDDDKIEFLHNLQIIHDNVGIVDWKDSLKYIADRHRLDHSILNQFESILV